MALSKAPIPDSKPRAHPRPGPFSHLSRAPAATPAGSRRGRQRLIVQLAFWFAVLALAPLCVTSYFTYRYAASGFLEDSEANLRALVTRQANEVRLYFWQAKDEITLLSGSPVLRPVLITAANLTGDNYAQYPDSDLFANIEKTWGPRMDNYVHELTFDQIYLINNHGVVVYSAGHSGHVFANLETAPDNQLAIASLFQQVQQKRTLCPSGMTMLTPTHRSSFYLGAPVFDHDGSTNLLGVLVFALDTTSLMNVLNNRIGLGDTGESIIFARQNGQFIIVNTPYYKPGASFTAVAPLLGTDKFGDGITPRGEALAAEGIGYRGHDVLAAWIYMPSLDWVLMQKIDRSEIFEPVERLRLFSVYIGAFTLVLVLAVAYSVARSITRPVVQLTQVAERIAQGDLNADITVRARNEIGLLAQAVSTMARSLKSLVGKVQDSAAVISANSVQMAASSRQQSEAASNTGAATVEVAAAAKQISATAEELARTMEQVNGVAQNTAQRAEAGLDGLHAIQIAVGELDQARGGVSGQLELIAQKAQAISVITVTMTKVADQTNLLSLNAAIEARRAGEYGRGFSVVAREIQRLADQAAVSTLEIEHTINEMAQAVATGVAGMKNFSIKVAGSIERIQTVSQQLTEVIQQVQGLPARFEMVLQGMQSQSEGARQITGAIAHMSESAQQTATVVQDSLRLIDQLRDTTHALQNEISLFKV